MLKNKFRLEDIRGDLGIYFNWSANMLVPFRPGTADAYLRTHRATIPRVAQQLLKTTGYVPETIYRGLLLKQSVHAIVPHSNLEYLSFSTDRKVAEHFADINGFGSKVINLPSQLGTHGYVIEYTPKITEILFHHQFLSMLPYAEGFTRIGMDGTSEVKGLKDQKEVTILQPPKPLTNIYSYPPEHEQTNRK